MHYCDSAPNHPLHGPYHDQEYGFPTSDDRVLFERLVLEIQQAGLSWEIVLKKRAAFKRAFDDFAIERVANYGSADIERLVGDASIIRNRKKIEATIDNASRLLEIRDSHGSFAAWIARHHPLDKASWVKLFRQTVRFTGPEVVGEFLMSIGYLPGAHRRACPVYDRIAALSPPWLTDGGRPPID